MPSPTAPLATALLLAVMPGGAGPSGAPEPPGPPGPGVRIAQLTFAQRIAVRVQREPAATATIWMEKKGPKCLPTDALVGVLVVRPDAVDLVSDDGERVRARLDDECAAVDFYGGFYLKPSKDGRLCAGRDAIRARSGQSCRIDRFRRLVAKR